MERLIGGRGRGRIGRIGRQVRIRAKLGIPLLAITFLTGYGYASAMTSVLIADAERAFAREAQEVAILVGADYRTHRDDRVALSESLRLLVGHDPTVRRVRIYRFSSAAPVLWASSDPTDHEDAVLAPHDVAPIQSGSVIQHVEIIDGVRLLETVHPVRHDGTLEASVGVYSSLDALDSSTARIGWVVALVTAVALVVQAIAIAAVLRWAVLRPLARLHRAAQRVAEGDLTVRLAEGTEPPARDEIASVARAFDWMVRAVADQRAADEQLAATDGLTGLLNRRSFDERFGAEVDRALRLQYPLSVSLVDLDGFKKLNDSQGHPAGDQALRSVAAALAGAVRGSDVLARYGGDEFAVIQPGCDREAAAIVGARLRAAVERLGIVTGVSSARLLSASVGAATLRPAQEAAAVVAGADAALYRAKARGGGVEVAVAPEPRGSAVRSVTP